MRTSAPREHAPQNVVFMPSVFNETLQLLMDAQEYFQIFGSEEHGQLHEKHRPLYSCEMSRITLRLSSVMAWLMIRRAVFSGKLTAEEAAEHCSLGAEEICKVNNRYAHDILPSYMIHLMDRSLDLYERVYRLDAMSRDTLH